MRYLSIIAVLLLVTTVSPAQDVLDRWKRNAKNKLNQKMRQTGRALSDSLEAGVQDIGTSFVDSLNTLRTQYDQTSFNYVISLTDNAGLFESKEKFEKNRKMLLNTVNVLSAQEMTPIQKAEIRIDAGEIFYAAYKYKMARNAFLNAKLIYETQNATDDINYAKSIANLGMLAQTTGRYTRAESFTYEAMQLRKNALGKESRAYAASINNYAVLQKDLGKYTDAEKLMEEAININQTVLGDSSLAYAITLNNKAILYQTVGRYQEAEPLLKKAIEISRGQLGRQSASFHKLWINLALLYQDMERYEEALTIYRRIVDLKKKKPGAQRSPDYAQVLTNMASLFVILDKEERVEELLRKSLNIYIARYGESHPAVASNWSDLGNYQAYKGHYNKAAPKLKRALDMRLKYLGENHPDYVQSMEDLAILYWKTGEYSKATQHYRQVLDKSMTFINEFFPPMSESEKAKFWDQIQPRFLRFYAFATDAAQQDPSIVGDMFNYHIATKALLLNASNKIRSKILNSGDQQLIDLYVTWQDQKETLAYLFNYSKEELADENINLDSLVTATNNTEKQLSERSDLFNQGFLSKTVSYEDIRSVLTNEEAVVEIVHFKDFSHPTGGNSRYAAFVLKKDQTGGPKMVLFKNGDEMDSKFYAYYNNAIKLNLDDEISYTNYWEQIDAKIGYKPRLYISLDGVYNQINIGSLREPDGRYVLDDKNISILSNSKDLIALKKGKKTAPRLSAMLFGYPSYGSSEISALPGTKKEVENISGILKGSRYSTKVFLGEQANETEIKNIKRPKILHIATHGYFMKDDVLDDEQQVFGVVPYHAKANPLLRSGVLLTDAGSGLSDIEDVSDREQNGILTAYEAMNLDLESTDIVILSACETGLGDIKSGEGVYGLQRSFLVAGSQSVIMSLWKVDDQATQELMSSFYKNWMRMGDKHEAFTAAQLELKEKYGKPYYWGAFVMIGG